jgi:hypothetical protein
MRVFFVAGSIELSNLFQSDFQKVVEFSLMLDTIPEIRQLSHASP